MSTYCQVHILPMPSPQWSPLFRPIEPLLPISPSARLPFISLRQNLPVFWMMMMESDTEEKGGSGTLTKYRGPNIPRLLHLTELLLGRTQPKT